MNLEELSKDEQRLLSIIIGENDYFKKSITFLKDPSKKYNDDSLDKIKKSITCIFESESKVNDEILTLVIKTNPNIKKYYHSLLNHPTVQ